MRKSSKAVIVSSPNKPNYSRSEKNFQGLQLYSHLFMPLWKPVEILALNTIISMPLPEDVLLSRINCIGCIPRDIFTTSFTSQVIDGAIVTFDASYIVRYVVGGVLPDDGVFSHKLVHVNSHQPFTRDNTELEFASDIVGKKIYVKKIRKRILLMS
jgi:hypothetical protein